MLLRDYGCYGGVLYGMVLGNAPRSPLGGE